MTAEAGSYNSYGSTSTHRLIDIPPSTAAITLKRQLYRHQSTAHELKLWCPASSYWCFRTPKNLFGFLLALDHVDTVRALGYGKRL